LLVAGLAEQGEDLAGEIALEFPESGSGGEALLGAVLGRVIDGVGVPAGPDDPQPGAGQDPDGVGWFLPRRRASAYSLAAHGELRRELLAKVVSACRAWCWLPTGRRRPCSRKLLKRVTPERVYMTTASDLLANRWQLAILLPPGMRQAGCWTRPELLVWGGAPRRNRTGDPILTMYPRPTVMPPCVFPGRSAP
jgi:hypothetical protein